MIVKIINSPIFIAAFVVLALFILKAQTKPALATEIRGVYKELSAIAEDASNDLEKQEVLRELSEQIATQIRSGLQAGFKSSDSKEKKESNEEKFLRLRNQVITSQMNLLESDQPARPVFTYKITNQTDQPIKRLKINYEFYLGETLIDVTNEWISEVKALAPGDSIHIKEQHRFSNIPAAKDPSPAIFDRIVLTVTDFDLIE
jgi:hypothetical protein